MIPGNVQYITLGTNDIDVGCGFAIVLILVGFNGASMKVLFALLTPVKAWPILARVAKKSIDYKVRQLRATRTCLRRWYLR